MAVDTNKTASVNIGRYVVSVYGTRAEVEAELAAGADIGAGFELARPEDILFSVWDDTNSKVLVYYIVRT